MRQRRRTVASLVWDSPHTATCPDTSYSDTHRIQSRTDRAADTHPITQPPPVVLVTMVSGF